MMFMLAAVVLEIVDYDHPSWFSRSRLILDVAASTSAIVAMRWYIEGLPGPVVAFGKWLGL